MTEVISKRGLLFSSSFLFLSKGKHNLWGKKKAKHAGSTGKESTSTLSGLCEVTQFSFVEKHAKGQTIFRAILHMEI